MMTSAQWLLFAQARSDSAPATQLVARHNRPAVRLSVTGRIRAAGVAIGPSVLLDLCVATSTAAVATGWIFRPGSRLRRLLNPLAVLGAAVPWVYFLAIRPGHRRWGATDDECRMPLPGDDAVPDPGYQHTRAIVVQAPTEDVWPWLAQIGQGRGGFYSYDWLENLAGCDIHSADRHGIEAEVRSLDEARDLPGSDAVVLGSPVYDGSWPPEATEFVYRHRDALATRPVWLFSVGAFGDHDPLVGRFMQKEPREIESLRRAIGPREYRVFAGAIKRDQFSLVGRLVFRGCGGHWGDNRNWAEIDAWSDSIGRALTSAPASSGRSHAD